MTTCLHCGYQDEKPFRFCPECGTKAPEEGQTDALVGRTLSDKYRIVGEIGSGAMGTVYLAEHVGLKKKIALKVLHPDLRLSDEQLQRFQREGIAAGKFNHPNAIQIFDFGKDGGTIYLAMEYVEGSNLHEYLDRKERLTVPTAVALGRQILSCLAEAHRHGIVHRDLKPDNVMVVPGSRGDVRVKVLDFGLSKLVALRGNEQSTLVTQVGRILGTPRYMSPEQCGGEETDARSDLYAVGLMLYEIVSGERPFREESASDILLSRATQEAPSLAAQCPGLEAPAELDGFLTRALQRRREDRFQSADEMLSALEALDLDAMVPLSAAGRPAARASGARGDAAPGSKRMLWVAALAFVVMAVVLGPRLFGDGAFSAQPLRVRDVPQAERSPSEDHYVRLLDLAWTALRSGNPTAARSTVGEALQSEQVDSEAYLLQAETFRALADTDAALVSYRSALDADEDYVAAHVGAGWVHLDAGDPEAALGCFERAVELDEANAEALTGLGLVHFEAGETERARTALERVLEADPKAARALLYLGRLRLDAGEVELAAETLLEARLAEPTWQAYAWLGEAYLAQDRPTDAENQWLAGVEEEDRPELRAALATLYLDQDRVAEAASLLTKARRTHTQDAELAVLHGTALHLRGNTADAVRALEDARRLGAEDPESMTLLALLYHATERTEEARTAYAEIRRRFGDVPRANLGLGLLHYADREHDQARDAFRRVLDYDDANRSAHFHLGVLEMEIFGDVEAARGHLARYVELGGEDERVGAWLAQLGG